MATIGHVGNDLFNGLGYNAEQYIISETFWIKEFIIGVVLMTLPIIDRQIKDGHQF